MRLSKEKIKNIAEDLDMGLLCYIHKQTKEVKSIIDPNQGHDMDGWEEDLEEIENNISDYFRLDPMMSRDAFQIMENFVNQLEESRTKSKLTSAIERSKPFRNFNNIIHDCEYREDWFAFKAMKQQEWVASELEDL